MGLMMLLLDGIGITGTAGSVAMPAKLKTGAKIGAEAERAAIIARNYGDTVTVIRGDREQNRGTHGSAAFSIRSEI